MRSLLLKPMTWIEGIGAAAFVLAMALIGALGGSASPASALTPTPTPALAWTFDVSPASPIVGDDIKLTAYASGDGGIPQYTLILKDSPAIVALESPASVSTNMLGVPMSWDLGTLGEGQAHYYISANYEREFCTPTCFFAFTIENSPQMTFGVGAGTPVPVGGIASLPTLENRAQAGRNYMALQIALITTGALVAVGAVAWFARRRVLR